ncbi:RepA leader peptide Tap [Klebsiella quasipneumoniae]|nr:RepA leader peptide Tap [Klebsiella quasipneumoniae]
MLRKLQAQFLCHSLLLCNISAGSGTVANSRW